MSKLSIDRSDKNLSEKLTTVLLELRERLIKDHKLGSPYTIKVVSLDDKVSFVRVPSQVEENTPKPKKKGKK